MTDAPLPGGPIPDTWIVGCDPGLKGAFVLYEPLTGKIIDYKDMPIYKGSAGFRTGIDPLGVLAIARYFSFVGVVLAVVEQIGRRPHESAGAATTAGYGSGCVEMALLSTGMRVERPAANVWKGKMRCPKDKWGAIQRADQIWPSHYGDWRGDRGGEKSGRAEAALIARFGAMEYLGVQLR